MNLRQVWRNAKEWLREPETPTLQEKAWSWGPWLAGLGGVAVLAKTGRRRALLGLAIGLALFLLYRFVWLTGWYAPYRLLLSYLHEQMPLADAWLIETLALVLTALLLAQGAALLSFVLFGKHKRAMLCLSLASALAHGGLGWYHQGRVVVDDKGRVQVRVVERPDGRLKVTEREYDPETGRRARWASENDLVMLDLQRRGVSVTRVGATGPFRSPQGTINVYFTRQNGHLIFYNGPRHTDVSGDMPRATEAVLREFTQQK